MKLNDKTVTGRRFLLALSAAAVGAVVALLLVYSLARLVITGSTDFAGAIRAIVGLGAGTVAFFSILDKFAR